MHGYLICPNCGETLTREGKTMKCSSGHSFDISKSGHVNLLLPSDKSSKSPGDNAEMVEARRNFLEKGYFKRLADEVAAKAAEVLPKVGGLVIDAGCGEGYYDKILFEFLEKSGISCDLFCTDISKNAVISAAKRCKGASENSVFAVASVYDLPTKNDAASVIINVFAPHAPEEFARVLQSGGHAITVVPAAKHLWELKELLYDVPYENPEHGLVYEGFELCVTQTLEYKMQLDCAGLQALFEMTPYAYKTPIEAKARLLETEYLDVTASFEILDFKKI